MSDQDSKLGERILNSMSEPTASFPEDQHDDLSFKILSPSVQAYLKTPVPDQLWHYTTISGMHAILETGEMYATDARFLNDREELVHSAKYADMVIQNQPYSQAVVDCVRQHVTRWFGVFLSLRNPYRNYVTCFTSRKDDLSQWRAYSLGSTGASVGLDLRGVYGAGSLAPCIYRDEDKRRLLSDSFEEMFKVSEMHFRTDPALLLEPDAIMPVELATKFPWAEKNMKLASSRLMFPIMRLLPLFKDSSFEAENEWRIVTLGAEKDIGFHSIFYRPRADSLVPTMKINLKRQDDKIPLTGLILGPGSHPNSTDAVTRYLRTRGFAVEAEPSSVPYRTTIPQ